MAIDATPKLFRALIALQCGIEAIRYLLSDALAGGIPYKVQIANTEAMEPLLNTTLSLVNSPRFILVYAGLILVTVASIASIYGLWCFKRWSRRLSLTLFVGLSVALPLLSHHVMSGVQQALSHMEVFLSGVVLAMAYFSALAPRFVTRAYDVAIAAHPSVLREGNKSTP